ncbi:MAG TPA: glycosyltransferase family 4 protein [Egibacteraceae bacterium]|nr:glycosyltransferase family 4 protein [Egibacteraceae bacterium]
MRVLMIAPPWFTVPPVGYGGTEWVVSLLTEGLVEAGHDVTLIASGGSQTKARLITVFDEAPSKQIGSPPYDLLHCLAGYKMRGEFDLIHDHSGCIGPAFGAMLDGPPVVHTVHGPWVAELSALYQTLPPKLHLVAISHDQRSRAPGGLHIDAVIHNGIPVELYPFRADRRDGRGYLAWVGRSTADKGPAVAVEVARRMNRPLRMAIKINEPAEEAYWRDHVAPTLDGVDVDVIPNANTAQKGELLAGADATLFPIQWPEPFGLVMVESMACGTPVLAYRNGAAAEVIADGETGFLVEPGDIEGLCDATLRVAEIDPAACRGRVERQLSGAAMTRRYDRLYREVIALDTEIRVPDLGGVKGAFGAAAGALGAADEALGARRSAGVAGAGENGSPEL